MFIFYSVSFGRDLHGGLKVGNIQRLHLKELKRGSPRTKSARARLQTSSDGRMTLKQLEEQRARWYCIAGKPLKTAGALLDKAPAGEIHVFGGEIISRNTTPPKVDDTKAPRQSSLSLKLLDTGCPLVARTYLPPIVRARFRTSDVTVDSFQTEHRDVVTAFISLPGIFAKSSKAKGIDAGLLNDTYSALMGICRKHEGVLRDFLFEDKGCTMICCWGVVNTNEFDALRCVLFGLEAVAAMSTLNEKVKIGISMGKCLVLPIGNERRRDWTVMGTEVNMSARLCAKAPVRSALCSETVYEATKDHVNFDMSAPMKLKGRDGEHRALKALNKKSGIIRRKIDANIIDSAIFVGRKNEMQQLHSAVTALRNEKKGGAFILEGLAGIGKIKETTCSFLFISLTPIFLSFFFFFLQH